MRHVLLSLLSLSVMLSADPAYACGMVYKKPTVVAKKAAKPSAKANITQTSGENLMKLFGEIDALEPAKPSQAPASKDSKAKENKAKSKKAPQPTS